jgi:hypothetical protein
MEKSAALLCYFRSRLSDAESEALYRQIHANGDQHLAWKDLVDHLTSHLRVDQEQRQELILTSQYPSKPKKKLKREQVFCARYVQKFSLILSSMETALTFWERQTCEIARPITDHDSIPLVDFCVIGTIHKIAIAKEDRRIIFLDT